MSDLRQAAQQALEALEHHVEQTRPIHQTSGAITSLRAALAEPEPFQPDWSLLEATQESLREHMEEVRQLRAALAAAVATERDMAGEIARLVRERDEQRKKLIPLLELARKAGHGIGDKK